MVRRMELAGPRCLQRWQMSCKRDPRMDYTFRPSNETVETMPYPIHRYQQLANLTPAEESALLGLGDPEQEHQRHDVLQREGEPVSGFFLLVEGWAISSIDLVNGRRAIQKLHLPGDMMGTPNMALTTAAYRLTAVTNIVTTFVHFQRFGKLFHSNPRLAALFTVAVQLERLMLMDTLAVVGNVSSKERVARLLLDIHDRLMPLGAVDRKAFHLPITQEIMSDMLGMTSVHMNRVLRELDREGLIERWDHMIRLNDLNRLRSIAAMPVRKPAFEPNWLPEPT